MYSKKELLDYCIKFSSISANVHDGEWELLMFFKIMYFSLNAILSELKLPMLKTSWHPKMGYKPEDHEDIDFIYEYYSSVIYNSPDSIPLDVICEAIKSLGGEVCTQQCLFGINIEDEPDPKKSAEEQKADFNDFFKEWLDDDMLCYFDEIMEYDSYYNSVLSIFHFDAVDRVLNRKLTKKEKRLYGAARSILEDNLLGNNSLTGYDPLLLSKNKEKTYILHHVYSGESWWADELGVGLGFVFAIIGLVILDQLLGGHAGE